MKRNFLSLIMVFGFFAGMLLISSFPLIADEGKITTDDGILKLTSEDGKFSYQLDARLYLDAVMYNEDEEIVDLHSGSEVRRMRFAIKATLWENFLAEIDFDFAENAVDIKDAYLGYKGKSNWMVKAGQFRAPFSLEEVTTSRYVSFIERGLPNAFPPGRKLGLGYYKWGKNWQVAGGIFGQAVGDIDEEAGEGSDEGYNLVGRATFAPLYKDNKIFHIGAAYSYQTTDAFGEDKLRFRAYPESKMSKIRFLNTGKVKDVDHAGMFGLESVLQLGSLHIQGEYMKVNVARIEDSGKPDYSLSGGYIFGSFFVTGDSMPYYAHEGEFGRVMPKKKGGALELLARYSWIDLNDLENGIEGGEGKNFTLGVNWHINPNYKLMFNYTKVDHDKYADADGDWEVPVDGFDYSVFAVRLMVIF